MDDWRDQAACRTAADPDVFFPLSEQDTGRVEAAQEICAGCRVSTDCLDEALHRGLDHGVFGGHTPEQRRLLRLRQVAR